MEPQKTATRTQYGDLYKKLLENIGDVGSRIKILENRYANLGRKVQLTDQSLLETEENAFKEIKLLGQDLLEVKKRLEEMKEKLDILENEMSSAARYDELKVLENYIDMWQPTNFVTRSELQRENRKL